MLPVLLAVAAIAAAGVRAVNRTIDDRDSSWTYEPRVNFGAVSASEPCQVCASQPDPTKAYGQTWEDCSMDGTATLTFNGTAVAIYVICPGPHVNGTYTANFSFELDGVEGPPFKPATGCLQNTYNYAVYSVKGLTLELHTIAVTNHPSSGQFSLSDLLLDYAVIDDGTPYPSSHASFPVAAVVVPVVVVVVLVIFVALWLVRRHRTANVMRLDTVPTPFKAPSLISYPMDTMSTVPDSYASNRGSLPIGQTMAQTGAESQGVYVPGSRSDLSPSPSGTTLVIDRKRSPPVLNPVLESPVGPPAYEDTMLHDSARH